MRVHGIRTQGRTTHGGHEKVENYCLNYTRWDSVTDVQFVNREGNLKVHTVERNASMNCSASLITSSVQHSCLSVFQGCVCETEQQSLGSG